GQESPDLPSATRKSARAGCSLTGKTPADNRGLLAAGVHARAVLFGRGAERSGVDGAAPAKYRSVPPVRQDSPAKRLVARADPEARQDPLRPARRSTGLRSGNRTGPRSAHPLVPDRAPRRRIRPVAHSVSGLQCRRVREPARGRARVRVLGRREPAAFQSKTRLRPASKTR